MLSQDLEVTLNEAFKDARAKRHEFMTVEHLLFALLDNAKAIEVLTNVGADLDALKSDLQEFIETTTPLIPAGDAQLSSGILGIDDTGSEGSQDQKNIVNNNYAFTDGTSFACPLVAGAVSLMYSVNPNISPAQIRDIIISTADKIGGANLYDNNGFDKSKRRAYGKINISAAVAQASR